MILTRPEESAVSSTSSMKTISGSQFRYRVSVELLGKSLGLKKKRAIKRLESIRTEGEIEVLRDDFTLATRRCTPISNAQLANHFSLKLV